MFVLYLVLFLAGMYLLGLGMTVASAWVFLGGLLAISVAVAMLFYLPTARERHDN
ncbi:hypothetical protein [Microbacterium sp.]|uniref:hypothetical protein n=1 Tax=Microbacterium sp. TaxID=51671 RepID=UPI0039E6FBA4